MSRKFGTVILAAGFSSRMGTFKPLMKLEDETIVERLIRISENAGLQDIVVVTGHNHQQMVRVLNKTSAVEVFNGRFEEGMFTSMQAGIAALPEDLDGFFIMPVDCPLVTEDILKQLMESFEPEMFSVPVYRGKKGHPLLIPSKFRQEILEHDGHNGLKAVTDRDFNLMQRIETGFEGIVMDMDTPEAYEEIKTYLDGGCISDDLQQLIKDRRFILIRHGEIQQHKEKIFLGQTDVPLSKRGVIQASQAGFKLDKMEIFTFNIYASDLIRAAKTAAYIKALIPLFRNLKIEPGFREMNLGPWDGRFISEIRETMPDEYEKRGSNIMTYKMGHGSENFYDLQYRVCKTLTRILKEDNSYDIVIVAHSGVLRVIENNLKGGDVSDPWDKMDNGEVRVIEK